MVSTKTLQNGVRVVVKQMQGLLSVTMGVLVGTGAAFETDEEDGISHFIEHLQFKGTDRHTACELSGAFDEIGAQVNAFTGKDMTCYYAKSTSDHAKEAFALLSELFLSSRFPEEEIARERGVVIEEINMDEDSPEDLCLDLLSRAAFGNSGYGRNILGPVGNVEKFTRGELFSYKKRRYCPENVVVAFAGNIDISLAEQLSETYFSQMERGAFEPREPICSWHSDNLFRQKQIEQTHFALAFPSSSRDSADYFAIQAMNGALGGGMSSRLFKRVREELGLAYSVYSYTTHYRETGLITVYAAVNPKKAEQALEAVVDVLKDFKKQNLTEEEFLRAREQLKAGSIFSQENTSSQMLRYGKQMLYSNETYDFEKKMQELSSLRLADALAAIERNFDFDKVAIASVGNLKAPLSIQK